MLRIKGVFLLIGLLTAGLSQAQIVDPVKWSFEVVDSQEGVYELVATAAVEAGWHVYANPVGDNLEPDFIGPYPTEFIWSDATTFELVGTPSESANRITHFDPQFEADLNYFESTARFGQQFKVLDQGEFDLNVSLSFMACDESKCVFPPMVELLVHCSEGKAVSVVDASVVDTSADGGAFDDGHNEGVIDPVHWSFSSEKVEDGVYDLKLVADIDHTWHLYSQHLSSDEGPLPTEFMFETGSDWELVNGVQEPEPHVAFDPNFNIDLEFFEDQVTFVQRVKQLGDADVVFGNVYFMACNDERCTPPITLDFQINTTTGDGGEKALEGEASFGSGDNPYLLDSIDLDDPASDCGEEKEEENIGMLSIFLLGFAGGFVALLTPCVFPMIPLTVSFFTKGSENRRRGLFRAITYGFFIFLIYISLAVPFHIWNIPPEILNHISTSATLNIFFFVVFVVFAISFFGYFEITLPSSWQNKADNASNKGGFIGIFFMALTLALVSFSCTGPILGSMLAKTITAGPWPLTAALAGFGVALGLPFALFAMFPGMMNSLPKSGGWLNSVKVVLGFAELALAIKFLSNADLVYQWNILHRETFFLLWIVISLATALYLFGVIKFPHDSPRKGRMAPTRLVLATLFFGFAIYLFPGVMQKPLWSHDFLAGFPPPKTYSWYPVDSKCPLALDCRKDFFEGVEAAREKNVPVFIDFTGWACVNCRKMEDNVWPEKEIYDILNQDVQVVSLYVDDKRARPDGKEEIIEITYDDGEVKKKKIASIGDMWSTLEILTFKNSTQPLYVMMTPDGQLLTPPVGYTPDTKEYQEWLECGLKAWEDSQN